MCHESSRQKEAGFFKPFAGGGENQAQGFACTCNKQGAATCSARRRDPADHLKNSQVEHVAGADYQEQDAVIAIGIDDLYIVESPQSIIVSRL